MPDPAPHETTMRRRILELVRAYPGLHLREIARQLDTSVALVEYHVPILLHAGDVEKVQDDRHIRLFPAGQRLPRRVIASLRDPRRLHIALALLEGPLPHKDLAETTGTGKSTLSFHLRRMEKAGLVEKANNEYRLRDPAAVDRLLQEHRPTPDLLGRFSNVWDDLYGN